MPSINEILLRVIGDADPARREIGELATELEAFGQLDPTAELHVDGDEAERELAARTAELAAWGRRTAIATLGLDDRIAKTKLAEARTNLARFAREKAEGKLGIDKGEFDAQLAAARAALEAAVAGKHTAKVDVAALGAFATLAKLEAASTAATRDRTQHIDVDVSQLAQLARALGAVSSAAEGAGGGGGVGKFLTEIPGIPPVSGAAAAAIAGVLVPSIVALGAALLAIVASLAAAAAGLGALGVAAAAAFGPVIALAGAAVFQLAKATQAQDAYKSAQEAVKSAAEGLANAEAGQQQAQTALTRARESAAEQIRNDLRTAVDGLRSAEDRLTDANYRAKRAEEDLTEARQAARRAIIDEQLAASSAALSHRGAILALRRARQELRQTEDDPGASRLDVAEARLRVAQAEDDVESSRIRANRAQRDANEAERQGVKGAPGVVDARHAVTDANGEVDDATRAVAEAERVLRRAHAATINQSPSVVAAREAIASADRQVAQAADRLTTAQRKANKALGDLKDSRGALAVVGVAKRIGRAFGPALDPIFRGIARGLRLLLPMIRSLQGPLRGLGQAMGRAFAALARELARPAWQRFFRLLLRSSAELVRVGGRGFILLLRILRNIAEAALPFLIRGLRQFNRLLAGVARDSKGVDLSGPIHQLGLWLDLAYELGRVFLGFVRTASGEGGGIVKWLADGAAAMADWLESDEGQERLKQFFEEVLPLAKDLVTFFGQLALALIQFGELVAPALDLVLKPINLLLKAINWILDLLNKPEGDEPLINVDWIGAVVGAFRWLGRVARAVFGFIGDAVRAVGKLFRGERWEAIRDVLTAPFRLARRILGNVFGWISDRISDLVDWVRDLFSGPKWEGVKQGITAPFRLARRVLTGIVGGIVGFVGDRFRHLVDLIGNVVGNIPGVIRRALRRAVRFLRGLIDDFVHIGKRLIEGLVDGIKSAAGDAVDAVKGVGEDIKDTVLGGFHIRSPSGVFRGYGERLMEGFRDGIRAGIRLVREASRDAIKSTKDVFQRGVQGIIDVFSRLPNGLSRTANQVARLFASLARVIRRAAGFVMQAVRRLTSALGSKLQLPSLELELPDLSPRGFAKGGIARQRMYEVGEEAPQWPEVILAINPRYRDRNLNLWAQAGQMLGVPGFAQGGIRGEDARRTLWAQAGRALGLPGYQVPGFARGGIAPVPGSPGESANSRIIGALTAFMRRWKLFLTDAYGAGHASPEHTQYGTAADFTPGAGGSWGLVGKAAVDAVRQGFTPVGWTGAGGTEAWAGHGPPEVAGGNAHLHVTFLTVAEYLAGKVLKGIAGAVAALIPKIGIKGEGPVAEVARAAVEKMRDAGDRFVERHQPTAGVEGTEPIDVGKGSVATVASRVARALRSPHKAVLALFEALWAESGMGSTSSNVLQLLPETAAGTGIGLGDVAGQVQGFLQRGYYGKGGAIELANTTNWAAHVIAQAVQGSAFASGSNYAAQKGPAINTLRSLGYRGFARGVRNFVGGLGIFGEYGPELAFLPRGGSALPADLTTRLTNALLTTPGGSAAFAGVGGGASGGGGDRIQHFHIHSVPGTGQPDPQITAAKLAILARQRRDF
ncbi:MAG: hypothetical protein AABM42_07360 [Actinomycetota bacterium]